MFSVSAMSPLVTSLYLTLFLHGYCQGLNVKTDLGATAQQQVWSLVNANTSVQAAATVPGGIYTDLRNAGVLTEEFYYRFNDHEYRWVAYDDWTYTRKFMLSGDYATLGQINLVFDGLDTAATVMLNNQQLCGCDNMYRRYVFPITSIVDRTGENTLVVKFASPVQFAKDRSDAIFVAPECVAPEFQGECHANQIRKMQASFSWDWGPAFPSVGIWKNVYVEGFDAIQIRDTVYNIMPANGGFNVELTVHGELPDTPSSGEVEIYFAIKGEQGNGQTISSTISYTEETGGQTHKLTLFVPDSEVSLWWPYGYGAQPLYTATVECRSTDNGVYTVSSKVDKIAFRTLRVVQDEVFPGQPDKGLSFYFEVNGVPIFAKGSNWIPAHVLPELGYGKDFTDNLLESSVEAGFNMLRVWGGGVYESDYFYQKCDELGILIWQDLLFACSMYPVDPPYLSTVVEEVRHNVRRLQHHPSIALWAGNNENEAALNDNWYGTQSNFSAYKEQYITLYVDTIRPVVLAEDPTRSYLVSSPSNGIKSEEDGYISNYPYSPLYGDIHYYNYIADGWDANIFPRTRFASEFGFQSFPSMASIKAVAGPGDLDLGLSSEMMTQRQHHPMGNTELQMQVKHRLLPPGDYSFDTEDMFAKLVPLTQMYQAMATKTEAECHRRWRGMRDEPSGEGFTMGSLYWQLNDIWQGPTWAGIEHSGKWKMLHYFAAKFYAPILVSSYVNSVDEIIVNVANDLLEDKTAVLEINVYSWAALGTPLLKTPLTISLPKENAVDVFSYDLNIYLTDAGCGNAVDHEGKAGVHTCFFVIRLLDNLKESMDIAPSNFYFPSPLGETVGLTKPNLSTPSITEGSLTSHPSRYVSAIDVVVQTDAIAPFVWLDAGDLKGRWTDNGFLMTEATKTVTFLALEPTTPSQLQNSISVTSLMDHWQY